MRSKLSCDSVSLKKLCQFDQKSQRNESFAKIDSLGLKIDSFSDYHKKPALKNYIPSNVSEIVSTK